MSVIAQSMGGLLIVAGAIVSSFSKDIRSASLWLWVLGLGLGTIYLANGNELLAIVQWIVSTLVSISMIFYAVMFGEYGVPSGPHWKKDFPKALLPVLLGTLFGGAIYFAAKMLPTLNERTTPPAQSLVDMGKLLTERHFLALQVLGISLFIVVFGAGILARPEVKK